MTSARGSGRDRGCGEDFRDDPRCAQPTDPDGGSIFTDGREPGGGRRNRSTSDHGSAGRTSASADEAARYTGPRGDSASAATAAGGGRTSRDDRTAAARTSADRSAAARTSADRSAAAHTCADRGRAATAQRRAQHRGLELTGQRHRQNQRESRPLTADLILE